MNSEVDDLIPMDKSRIDPVAEMFTRAFWNYPVSVFAYPEEKERERKLPHFFRYIIHYCLKYGEAYITSPAVEGAALWLPSDKFQMTFWRLVRSVPPSVFINLGGGAGMRMKAVGEFIDGTHLRLVPYNHLFLQTVGVDPEYQGKGYGSRLLKPVLERTDEEELACYLETHDEENVPKYQSLGFKVLEKAEVPGTSLVNWAMLRDNRTTT
ncbi:GNAT family N-acetyltransferase [Chloroflexota bacterium]